MILAVLLFFAGRALAVAPPVFTALGEIHGLQSENGQYFMYMGVPYAIVDELNPFSEATPHPGYAEPVLAYSDQIACPQFQRNDYRGTVQCLILNIYVPDTTETNLPVMVWLHGGAWIEGSASRDIFSPTYLVKQNVIVVTLNYRLGLQGFLCTDSAKAPGNIGLKDQLLALRWVRDHIRSFGGDAEQITAFGESAGGMSVHLHMLSPHEKLFNRAIIQSGASSSPWTFVTQHNDVPITIANEMGFETEDLDDALDFLSRSNIQDVVVMGHELDLVKIVNNTEPKTKVCVERQFEGIERFVTTHPDIAHSIKAKDIDVIIGYNSEEMIFKHGERPPAFFSDLLFQEYLGYGFEYDSDEMEILLKHFYFGDDPINIDLENEITHFASDLLWNHPTERAIQLLLEDEVKSLYQYIFSYDGRRNFVKITYPSTEIPGASHADDLGYIFDLEMFMHQEDTPEDFRVLEQMTTMWTNFAKYGDPTPEITELLPVKWLPVTAVSRPSLNINGTLTVGERPFLDRIIFWDLFYEYYRDKAFEFSDSN